MAMDDRQPPSERGRGGAAGTRRAGLAGLDVGGARRRGVVPPPCMTFLVAALLLLCRPHGVGAVGVVQYDDNCEVRAGILVWNLISRSHGLSAAMAVHHMQTGDTSLVALEAGTVICRNITFYAEDTLGSPTKAVGHAIDWNSKVDFIMGAARSAVSGVLSLASHIYGVPVISYGSTAATLSDSALYPSFHRVVPPDTVLASITAQLCFKLNFTRVGILFINDPFGSGYAIDFGASAEREGIEIVTSQPFIGGDPASMRDAVDAIAAVDVRVIVVVCLVPDMRGLLDAAEVHGMLRTPGYSWFLNGFDGPEDFASKSADPEKTRLDLSGWLTVSPVTMEPSIASSFSQKWGEYLALNRTFMGVAGAQDDGTYHAFASFSYDAMWLAVIAASRAKSATAGPEVTTYTELLGRSVIGTSGRLQLAPNGDRSAGSVRYAISNYNVNQETGVLQVSDIGTWDSNNGFLWSREPVWPGPVQGWESMPRGISLCDPGYAFSATVLECAPCPPGTQGSGLKCTPCSKGTIAPVPGMFKCVNCKGGFADEEGLSECKKCPDFSFIPSGSEGKSREECACLPGAYRMRRNGNTSITNPCIECDAGADCPGLDFPPIPMEGFWGDAECKEFGGRKECPKFAAFVECNPREACIGGTNFSCGPGRTGRMCMNIEDDWFNIGSIFFFECGDTGIVATAFAIMLTCLAWLGMNTIASSNYEALDIALLFLQITGMIAAFTLRWHPNLSLLNTILGLVNFEVDFVSPCPHALNAETLFYIQLVLPLFFAIYYFVYYAAKISLVEGLDDIPDYYTFVKKVWYSMRGNVVAMVIVGYHQISMKSFGALKCLEFQDGKSYLRMAPSIECWVGSHITMAMVAIFYIIFVVFGLPIGVVLYTRQRRWKNELKDCDLDFLFERYEVDWIWWHSVLIVRRMFIAFILMVIEQPMIQGGMATVVLSLFIVLHSHAKPFISEAIDSLEMTTLLATLLYTLSGLMFFPSLSTESQGFICPSAGERFCELDNWSKSNLSIMVLSGFLLVILVCIGVTIMNVVEVNREKKALTRIHDFLKESSAVQNDNPSGAVGRVDDNKNMHGSKDTTKDAKNSTKDSSFGGSSGRLGNRWNKITKVVRASSFNVVQLKKVVVAPGDNERVFEAVVDANVLSRWARWVGTKTEAEHHAVIRAKKHAAQAFVGVRSKFNTIEAVSEHTVTTIAQVVRHVSQVEGILDWVITRSTLDERKLFADILRGLAEFHDEVEDPERYTNLIRPNWRPTMLWFALKSNAARVDETVLLLDSILKHGKPSEWGAAQNGDEQEEEEFARLPSEPKPAQPAILDVFALAKKAKKEANPRFVHQSVFKEDDSDEDETPAAMRPGGPIQEMFARTASADQSGRHSQDTDLRGHSPENSSGAIDRARANATLGADIKKRWRGTHQASKQFHIATPLKSMKQGSSPSSSFEAHENGHVNGRVSMESARHSDKNGRAEPMSGGKAEVNSSRLYGSSRKRHANASFESGSKGASMESADGEKVVSVKIKSSGKNRPTPSFDSVSKGASMESADCEKFMSVKIDKGDLPREDVVNMEGSDFFNESSMGDSINGVAVSERPVVEQGGANLYSTPPVGLPGQADEEGVAEQHSA